MMMTMQSVFCCSVIIIVIFSISSISEVVVMFCICFVAFDICRFLEYLCPEGMKCNSEIVTEASVFLMKLLAERHEYGMRSGSE